MSDYRRQFGIELMQCLPQEAFHRFIDFVDGYGPFLVGRITIEGTRITFWPQDTVPGDNVIFLHSAVELPSRTMAVRIVAMLQAHYRAQSVGIRVEGFTEPEMTIWIEASVA